LSQKTAVEAAEADHPGLQDERAKRFPEVTKPFGFQHAEWEALKVEMKPGDELWTFTSPPETWRILAGRAGIALVRDGEIVRFIVRLMN
jgi:hypothetical protein